MHSCDDCNEYYKQQHIQFALFKAQHTIARDEAMDVIHAHLNSDSCSPVIVTGGSGTGKTTFLAQLVDILRRSDDVIVAARFAGATCKCMFDHCFAFSICVLDFNLLLLLFFYNYY